eukprot:TRINITY_DN66486_c5_g5_i3.p1 TRINITY_DN66486_c5_g5~~TRINITY_DN66486_c5_g5_i3.p1  ORF type:complete len:322 (+),score=30.68 TRINITY_DN66486_c5_g5_i3:203-1168(+)
MPHINLIYPFVSAEDFAASEEQVKTACANIPPFELEFNSLGHFSYKNAIMWCKPETPARPKILKQIQSAVRAIFPHCNDLSKDFTPHLTLGQFPNDVIDAREAEFSSMLPIKWKVRSVQFITRTDSTPFSCVSTIELTGDPKAPPPPTPVMVPRGGADHTRKATVRDTYKTVDRATVQKNFTVINAVLCVPSISKELAVKQLVKIPEGKKPAVDPSSVVSGVGSLVECSCYFGAEYYHLFLGFVRLYQAITNKTINNADTFADLAPKVKQWLQDYITKTCPPNEDEPNDVAVFVDKVLAFDPCRVAFGSLANSFAGDGDLK